VTTTYDRPARERTTVVLRPRAEGANIRTWVGFKHFMYLVEEAVLAWFRERGMGPSALYREHGIELSVVDMSVRLPAVLDWDDEVEAEVSGGPVRFTVRLTARRDGAPTVLRGRVTVALIAPAGPALLPDALRGNVVNDLTDPGVDRLPDPDTPLSFQDSGFTWAWRVPYYYCQFSRRVALSGYVRALEEVVDQFLTGRGLSVRTTLAERGWIPVVSRARVSLHADTGMEDTVHTVFRITDVLKGTAFDARMDCYVVRSSGPVHTASARILHGYAIAGGPDAGSLAQLDEPTLRALTGGGSP
jgi:acyl-CoA thioesterase FadM